MNGRRSRVRGRDVPASGVDGIRKPVVGSGARSRVMRGRGVRVVSFTEDTLCPGSFVGRRRRCRRGRGIVRGKRCCLDARDCVKTRTPATCCCTFSLVTSHASWRGERAEGGRRTRKSRSFKGIRSIDRDMNRTFQTLRCSASFLEEILQNLGEALLSLIYAIRESLELPAHFTDC